MIDPNNLMVEDNYLITHAAASVLLLTILAQVNSINTINPYKNTCKRTPVNLLRKGKVIRNYKSGERKRARKVS